MGVYANRNLVIALSKHFSLYPINTQHPPILSVGVYANRNLVIAILATFVLYPLSILKDLR